MSVSQPPPPIVHPKVSEPYVFWDMDLHGDVPFSGSTGSIGDLRYYGLKNANPLWSAKSVIFYKETKTYVEQSVSNSPGHRETIYLSAWIVNIETGESTGFFLGAPQTVVVMKPGWPVRRVPLGDDQRDIYKELRDWFQSLEHVPAAP